MCNWSYGTLFDCVSLFMQGLTPVEEMLISAILPIMTLYRLPHGQYGYSGHVINLPQDIASLADKLPRTPSELDVVVIRKEGAVDHHRDFRVRRSVVLHALQWLTANNMYYRNVSIDQGTLALLPVDGNLAGLVTMAVESDDPEPPAQQDILPQDTPLNSTFVPMPTTGQTEQQTIRQSMQQVCAPPVLPWPSSSGTPINEFTTEGYMSCAFPTLFPTGMADFVAPRPRTVLALGTTSSTSCSTMTAGLPSILASDTLLSILK